MEECKKGKKTVRAIFRVREIGETIPSHFKTFSAAEEIKEKVASSNYSKIIRGFFSP